VEYPTTPVSSGINLLSASVALMRWRRFPGVSIPVVRRSTFVGRRRIIPVLGRIPVFGRTVPVLGSPVPVVLTILIPATLIPAHLVSSALIAATLIAAALIPAHLVSSALIAATLIAAASVPAVAPILVPFIALVAMPFFPVGLFEGLQTDLTHQIHEAAFFLFGFASADLYGFQAFRGRTLNIQLLDLLYSFDG
jgi:hypothetical protein